MANEAKEANEDQAPAADTSLFAAKAPRGRPFRKGRSGNPGGRPKEPAELRAVLAASSLDLYQRGLQMLDEAQAAGDLATASRLLLALLKKSLPDAATIIEVGGPGSSAPVVADVRAKLTAALARLATVGPGEPVEGVRACDLRFLSDEDLSALEAISERARSRPIQGG